MTSKLVLLFFYEKMCSRDTVINFSINKTNVKKINPKANKLENIIYIIRKGMNSIPLLSRQ